MKKTILVSLAGFILFLFGCTQQTPVSNQNLNQPTANVNQNANQPVANQNVNTNQVQDPYAGWATFTNKEFEYSVKYPQELNAKEWAQIIKAGDSAGVNNWLLSEVAFGKNTELGDWQISITVSSRSLAEEKELAKMSIAKITEKNVTIDGINSIKYIGNGGEGLTGRLVKILVSHKNKVYSLNYSEVNNKNNNLIVFDKIIETFQFTK